MKLQIQNQTLRFRIGETELVSLLDDGGVETRTHLPGGVEFALSLVCGKAPVPQLECLPQQWSVTLPETDVRAYAEKLPSRNGLKWIIDNESDAITLVFEVDVHDSIRNRDARLRSPRASGDEDGRHRPSQPQREDA